MALTHALTKSSHFHLFTSPLKSAPTQSGRQFVAAIVRYFSGDEQLTTNEDLSNSTIASAPNVHMMSGTATIFFLTMASTAGTAFFWRCRIDD